MGGVDEQHGETASGTAAGSGSGSFAPDEQHEAAGSGTVLGPDVVADCELQQDGSGAGWSASGFVAGVGARPVKRSIRTPVSREVTAAARTRATAIGQPISARVSDVEGTSISGVEMAKAAEAPLDAPERCRAAAVGMTEQEHSGMGMPTSEASETERTPGLPRDLASQARGTSAWMTPAIAKPTSSQRADSAVMVQRAEKKLFICVVMPFSIDRNRGVECGFLGCFSDEQCKDVGRRACNADRAGERVVSRRRAWGGRNGFRWWRHTDG